MPKNSKTRKQFIFKQVTCSKCGWVAVAVSRKYAEAEVTRFNTYFETLLKEEQEDFYGSKPAHIRSYEQCMYCLNNYKNFKAFKKGDCPDGCTLNPIIRKDD